MKNNLYRFSPHLKISHEYWKNFLKKDHIAVDATCGNGYDSLVLLNILLKPLNGHLFCFDIQKKAIENTYVLLKENTEPQFLEKIIFLNESHEDFSKFIKTPINLFIYNLGYLPKGDKTLTTKKNSTLNSIKSAMQLLAEDGAISIISYPGHKEGAEEEKELIDFFVSLDRTSYSVCYHKWLNKEKAPSFFWIERKISF
ncbi:MAG: class I SAM-dependent methyltransferase [Parachlamydiales bacterium]|jgi:hypothetical protein